MHPTEDDLILHFYGDGRAPDEARLDEHLRTCASCEAIFAELRETMQMVDAADVPEPSPGFERVMWARVQQALPAPDARRSSWFGRSWLPATAWAAVALAAVAVGYAIVRPASAPVAQPEATVATANSRPVDASRARERVLLAALDSHFQQTETLLVEVLNAPASGGALAFERTTADDLVSSGRLYRVTAEQNGDRQLAKMLDDLEVVLVEVARRPDKPTDRDVRALQQRIDSNDLLFKVRAVTNEIRERRQVLNSESE